MTSDEDGGRIIKTEKGKVINAHLTVGRILILHVTGMETPETSIFRIYRQEKQGVKKFPIRKLRISRIQI